MYNIKRVSMIHNLLLKFLKQNQNEQLNLCKFIEKNSFSFQIKPKSDEYQYTKCRNLVLFQISIVDSTAKNTVISPNFLVWKFCGKEQFPHSFGQFARNYTELFLSTKFPHQQIKWNYGIFCSVLIKIFRYSDTLITLKALEKSLKTDLT